MSIKLDKLKVGKIYLYRDIDKEDHIFLTGFHKGYARGIGEYSYVQFYYLNNPNVTVERITEIFIMKVRETYGS